MTTAASEPSLLDSICYNHWMVFAGLLKQLSAVTPQLVCAVYSRQLDRLIFPGSNVGRVLSELTGPQKLASFIRENKPRPFEDDQWAGGVACKHILGDEAYWADGFMLAKMGDSGNVFAGRFSGLKSRSNLARNADVAPLHWPDEFLGFVRKTFPGRQVWFGAFPLGVGGPGMASSSLARVRHVVLLYFSPPKNGRPGSRFLPHHNWLPLLRDLLLLGTLTHLSEQMAVWDRRMTRLRTEEGVKGLKKFNPRNEEDQLLLQGLRLSALRQATLKARHILIPPVIENSPKATGATKAATWEPRYYAMPKYNLPSLRRLLLSPTQPASEDVYLLLTRLVEFLSDEFYCPGRRKATPGERSLARNLVNERSGRLADVRRKLDRVIQGEPVALGPGVTLRKAQETDRLLRRLFGTPGEEWQALRVLDESFEPASYEVKERAPDLLKGLPSRLADCRAVCPVHGDLHFDNVLVDSYFPDDPIFVLVDPRPNDLRDPAADVAKLLFSCHAGYDFIDTGSFDVNLVPINPPGNQVMVHMKIPDLDVVHRQMPGGHVAFGLISTESTLPGKTRELYDTAGKAVCRAAEELGRRLDDPDLLSRARLLEGLFCLTLSPEIYVANPRGALALALRGCQLLGG